MKLKLIAMMAVYLSLQSSWVIGQNQNDSATMAWRKDAGEVAQIHVREMLNSGMGTRAALVGYQRGLGVPLIAIYNYEGYTSAGFLKRTMLSVAMRPDALGYWYVMAVEEGGVFEGLPLRRDWRQVGEDGGRANDVRRRGY